MTLRELRLRDGLSQQQVAVVCGVARSTLAKYERGELCIPAHVLLRLEGVYSWDLADWKSLKTGRDQTCVRANGEGDRTKWAGAVRACLQRMRRSAA